MISASSALSLITSRACSLPRRTASRPTTASAAPRLAASTPSSRRPCRRCWSVEPHPPYARVEREHATGNMRRERGWASRPASNALGIGGFSPVSPVETSPSFTEDKLALLSAGHPRLRRHRARRRSLPTERELRRGRIDPDRHPSKLNTNPAHAIEGETSEIIRDILGERVLGLPGDVRLTSPALEEHSVLTFLCSFADQDRWTPAPAVPDVG